MNIFDTIMGHQFIETFNRKCPEIARDIKSIKDELKISNELMILELISKGIISNEQAQKLKADVNTEN